MVFAIVAGGAAQTGNIHAAEVAEVEIIPSGDSNAQIVNVDAYQDGPDLVVAGTIKKRLLFSSQNGHIDVAIVAPNGKITELGAAEYRTFPSRHRTSSFEVRFPSASAKDAEVRLVAHREDGSGHEHAYAVRMLGGKEAAAHR